MTDIEPDSKTDPSMTRIEELEGAIADSEELLLRLHPQAEPSSMAPMRRLLKARLEQMRGELQDLRAGTFSRIGVRLTR